MTCFFWVQLRCLSTMGEMLCGLLAKLCLCHEMVSPGTRTPFLLCFQAKQEAFRLWELAGHLYKSS